MWPQKQGLDPCGHQPRNASSHQKPEEGMTDSQHLWRECGPAHTLILMEWNWFQTSGFQNWETLSVCYLGPPSLWWLVTAATGDKHSSLGSGICNNWDHLVLGGSAVAGAMGSSPDKMHDNKMLQKSATWLMKSTEHLVSLDHVFLNNSGMFWRETGQEDKQIIWCFLQLAIRNNLMYGSFS